MATSFTIVSGVICVVLALWAAAKGKLVSLPIQRLVFGILLACFWLLLAFGVAYLREGWRLMPMQTLFAYSDLADWQETAMSQFQAFFTIFRATDETYGYMIATPLIALPLFSWMLCWKRSPPFLFLIVLILFAALLGQSRIDSISAVLLPSFYLASICLFFYRLVRAFRTNQSR